MAVRTRSGISEEHVKACVLQHRPGANVSIAPIPTGKFNQSYFVRAEEEDLVIRIAPPKDSVLLFYERDMMRQEPDIHALLRAKTSVPVARIVVFDDSHAVIPRDFILMERLPGISMAEAGYGNEDHVLRQVGQCLAHVHALTEKRYGYLGAHRPMEPQSTWAEAFRVMWRLLTEDIVQTGHYTRDEQQQLLALLETHLTCFDRDVPASLLHMDIWAQNILVSADGLTGLVDWDRALWGDPEIEFAVLDYCGISQPAFWDAYGGGRDTSYCGHIRNTFYLLYEIQKYIVIRHGRNNDPASARRYKEQALRIIRQELA